MTHGGGGWGEGGLGCFFRDTAPDKQKKVDG